MIKPNIRNLFRAKGISAPLKWMTTRGIADRTARQLLKGTGFRINFAYINILCYGLRCTPDELFTWEPDNAEEDAPSHPLQKLRKKMSLPDVNNKLKDLSAAEIKQVNDLIDGLKQQDK